tara:strand:- start:4474 stop:5391 length:918 start_codon:yes stop_codon:yes gene_type:complete
MSLFFDFNFNNDISEFVSITIQGGLGNQLFQIATAYAYSIRNKKKLIFKYNQNYPNNFNLTRKGYWDNLFSKNLKTIDKNTFDDIQFINYYEKYNCLYKEIPYIEKNILLNGYYQSFKYFDNDDTRNFLRHLVYSSKNLMYLSYNYYNKIKLYFTKLNNLECNDDDLVSIHIRRTDFILTKKNYHNVLDIDYYIKALDITKKKNVVIFSDDIEWCKININNNIIKNKNLYYIDINIEEIEFILMSLIKNNIIANSTFSLMASYISYYEDKKIIIAPKKWLSDAQIKENNGIVSDEFYHKDITHII